jgi:DDE_Tnp_1-associated
MSPPLTLLDVLVQVPDPRSRHGRRHPLSAILSLAVVAMLSGAKSYQAIAQFGRDKGFALAHTLGFTRGKTPTKSTFSVLFRILDVQVFETMGEDASRIRKGVAPKVMAALRNSILHVLSDVVAPSVASAMRTMGNRLAHALGILSLPQLE